MKQPTDEAGQPRVALFDSVRDEEQILQLLENLIESSAASAIASRLCKEALEKTRIFLEESRDDARTILIALLWDSTNDAWLPVLCEPIAKDDTERILGYTSSLATLFIDSGANSFEFRTTNDDQKVLALCVQALLELFMLKESTGKGGTS